MLKDTFEISISFPLQRTDKTPQKEHNIDFQWLLFSCRGKYKFDINIHLLLVSVSYCFQFYISVMGLGTTAVVNPLMNVPLINTHKTCFFLQVIFF